MNAHEWLSSFLSTESSFEARLALTLLHFVWQGLLIAIIAGALSWLLRKASASSRYWVNTIALFAMAVSAPITFTLLRGHAPEPQPTASAFVGHDQAPVPNNGPSLTAPQQARVLDVHAPPTPFATQDAGDQVAPVESNIVNSLERTKDAPGEDAPGEDAPFARVLSWLTIVYFCGVTLMLVRLARSLWLGNRLNVLSRPVDDRSLLDMVARQATRLGGRCVPNLAFCSRVAVPTVVGIFKPLILLPLTVSSGLTPRQLEALLAHELAHIQRFDMFVNLVQRVIEAVLFFHPAVWMVSRRVSMERENVCDDVALSAGWDGVEYADALVRMAEVSSAHRGGPAHAFTLAASGGRSSELKRRVMRLLGQQNRPSFCLTRSGVTVLVVTIAVMAFAPLLMSAWAQPTTPSKETPASGDREPKGEPQADKQAIEASKGREKTSTPKTAQKPGGDDDKLLAKIDTATIHECKNIIRELDGAVEVRRTAQARERFANRLEKITKQPVTAFTREIKQQEGAVQRGGPVIGVQTDLDGHWSTGKGTAENWTDWIVRKQARYRTDRLQLLFDAGKGYRSLNDMQSAKRVLEAGLKGEEIYERDLKNLIKQFWAVGEHTDPKVLGTGPHAWTIIGFFRELAPVLHAIGDLDGAINVQTRNMLAQFMLQWNAPSSGPVDNAYKLWRMIREHGEPLPPIFWFNVLDQDRNKITFDLSDSTKKGNILKSHNQNVVSFPTHDFRELKVTADFDGNGGFLSCFTRGKDGRVSTLGQIGVNRPESDEVESLTKTIAIPAGTDIVQFAVRGNGLRVGKVTVVASFQKRGREDKKTAATEKQEDKKPAKLTEAQKRADAKLRAAMFKPAWGKASEGIQLGIAITSDQREFAAGERVPLECYVRNVTDRTVAISHSFYTPHDPPNTKGTDGKSMTIDRVMLRGGIPLYRATLKPNEIVRVHHLGVGLGENPKPGTFWLPYAKKPVPGKYRLWQDVRIKVIKISEPERRLSLKLTSGEVTFEVAKQIVSAALPGEKKQKPTKGMLVGKFVFDGTPPRQKPLNVAAFGRAGPFAKLGLKDESLIVSKDGGIKNVVVWVRSKDVPVLPVPKDAKQPVLKITGGLFSPRVLAFQAPAKLKLENTEKFATNVNWQALVSQPFNMLVVPQGGVETQIKTGDLIPGRAASNVHPWMVSWIFPCKHSYFAVSKADGSFEIPNLPIGEWEFGVWHERSGILKTESWPKGRFTLEIHAGQNSIGTAKVTPDEINSTSG